MRLRAETAETPDETAAQQRSRSNFMRFAKRLLVFSHEFTTEGDAIFSCIVDEVSRLLSLTAPVVRRMT
jgi:hypothetical protein